MRADMFRSPVARFFLKGFNVSPVYRFEEGLENVHKNLDTFKWIYDILKKNGNYVVFSEGICVQEKRLQKLRKGTARMAFGAAEQFGLDVHIVPVGINYTYPAKFRKEVLINFHEPFSIKELQELYNENPAKALLAFNRKVEAGLLEQVIIVENPDNDRIAEQLLVMGRNNHIHPFFMWRFDNDERRLLEKRITDKINFLSKNGETELANLKKKTEKYSDILKRNKIKDENIARKLDWGFVRYLSVILGLPFFIAGYLANLIPYTVPRIVCNTMIKDLRFYSSVYIGFSSVLYLIYFPVVLILAGIFAGWLGVLLGFLVPILGYLVLFYQEVVYERFHTFRYWYKKMTKPAIISELISLRKEIMDALDGVDINRA
jgi:hypothetical protein